jgi:hypothetical protein
MSMVFWVVKPCVIVSRYHHIGETYRLDLQGSTFLRNLGIYLQVPHGVATQKTNRQNMRMLFRTFLPVFCNFIGYTTKKWITIMNDELEGKLSWPVLI